MLSSPVSLQLSLITLVNILPSVKISNGRYDDLDSMVYETAKLYLFINTCRMSTNTLSMHCTMGSLVLVHL